MIFDITFLMVAMTLTFQILGIGKAKVFLVFAMGGYIGLITSFTDNVAFVIVLVGLILFNGFYFYTSWSES